MYFCYVRKSCQEKKDRTKADSGNYVENTQMRNNYTEGIRQIGSVTSGEREP